MKRSIVLAAFLFVVQASAALAQDAGSGGTAAAGSAAQTQAADKSSFEVYGFAMLDIGHDFKTINPNW